MDYITEDNFFFHRIHILDQATGIDLVWRLFGSKISLLGEKAVNGSDDDDDNEDFVSVNEDNTEYISFYESFKLKKPYQQSYLNTTDL